KGVRFIKGSNELSLDSRAILDEVAKSLLAYPDVVIEIQGHTDAVGSEAYNMTLSERRATAVRNYLLGNFDLSALQLTAKGYGESDPIASNETDEGRARNRRVQFVIEE
ncbi:MAG: OmpA family protein, partial [Candidatus Palauibacterales bacterium]|nr:OmpA family protein [Candidatus Palauibacterales bacterium]